MVVKISSFLNKPKNIKIAPTSSNRCDIFATRSTFGILTPAKTGSICIIAPNIIKLKKPMVIVCVITIESIEYLLFKIEASLKKINTPANIPNKGAVKKNLSGADIGGA